MSECPLCAAGPSERSVRSCLESFSEKRCVHWNSSEGSSFIASDKKLDSVEWLFCFWLGAKLCRPPKFWDFSSDYCSSDSSLSLPLTSIELHQQNCRYLLPPSFPFPLPLKTSMASSLRLGSAILRSSSVLSRPTVQNAAFNGVRCASTKVQTVKKLEQPSSLMYLYLDPERDFCRQPT